MNMKKKVFLLPLFALLFTSLTGCGHSNEGEQNQGDNQQEQTPTPTPSGGDQTPSGGDQTPSGGDQTPSGGDTTPVVEKVTVTFHSNGGSSVRKQEIDKGTTATKPTNPTKAGYDFVNWYTEAALTNVFDFTTPVNQNIDLYAKWALSVSPVLLASVTPDAVDAGDTEFSVWTSSEFVGHSIDGWQTGCTLNMSWRTVLVVDAEGRLCYGVYCPANGYGSPREYSYMCNEYYAKDGVGYTQNPAFRFGSNFASNSNDWQLVVPTGGFIITGHTNGSRTIDSLATGGKFTNDAGAEDILNSKINATHAEFSTRSFKFREGKVEVYDLATHLTYTGTKAGAFVGNAETATYSKTLLLYEGNTIRLEFFDGIVEFALTESLATFTGDYTTTRGGDHNAKMYVASDETKDVLIAGARGRYQFDYSYSANTLTITYTETNSFYLYLNNVLCDEVERMNVTYNEAFTLPTPTVPTGYTFSRWVNSAGQTVESGTYGIKDDMNLYAAFRDSTNKEYAYVGKQAAASTTADTQFTVVDSTRGFIAHSHSGWNVGCTWNMSWRTFAIIDAEGRVCYAVWCAANGYGGPKAYTYHCDPHYQATGVGWEGNPIFTIDPEFDDWPNKTTDNRNAWDLFTIEVPTGGYIISTHSDGANDLVTMLSGGQLTEAGAALNEGHSWDNRFEVINDVVYCRLNLA